MSVKSLALTIQLSGDHPNLLIQLSGGQPIPPFSKVVTTQLPCSAERQPPNSTT
ncbi:hypothetical protein BgiBS90_026937, partial [Biomphalaria glabrata]